MVSEKDRHVREKERTGHESLLQSHWDLLEPVCSEGRFQMQAHKGSSASLGTLQGRAHLLPIAAGEETQKPPGVIGLEDSKKDGREWK